MFKFLRYLQPTHYFGLLKENDSSIFPVVNKLPKDIIEQLVYDKAYASTNAKLYDLSWQAIHKGHIDNSVTYSKFDTIPLVDEYRFIRKYFNSVWVFYVLILRLLSFKSPVKEIRAFFKSRSTKRSTYLKQPIAHSTYNIFNSKLLNEAPKVTVIIPTLNRYQYLKDGLRDLEQQDYKNFNVIIVDQSQPFQPEFYKQFELNLVVIQQEEKALWLARNTAIRQSDSNYLLLYDDDSRVEANWISEHLKCLDFFKADISSGVSISTVGAKVPEHYSFFKISDQLDTGNVMIKRHVFETIGLFDRQFEKQRMGDGEFGLRAFLSDFKNISNPNAKRLHLKVGSGGLREMGSWDAFRTKKWFAPRPIPSVLYFFRSYFGSNKSKLAILRTVPMSMISYRFKKNRLMLLLGGILAVILIPIVSFQVWKSWNISTKMLKQGPKIETLH